MKKLRTLLVALLLSCAVVYGQQFDYSKNAVLIIERECRLTNSTETAELLINFWPVGTHAWPIGTNGVASTNYSEYLTYINSGWLTSYRTATNHSEVWDVYRISQEQIKGAFTPSVWGLVNSKIHQAPFNGKAYAIRNTPNIAAWVATKGLEPIP